MHDAKVIAVDGESIEHFAVEVKIYAKVKEWNAGRCVFGYLVLKAGVYSLLHGHKQPSFK